MWTLKKGTVAHIDDSGGTLLDLTTQEHKPIRPEDVDFIRLLCEGVEETNPECQQFLPSLESTGWVEQAVNTHDEQIEHLIKNMNRKYEWCLGETAPEIIEVIQHAHACRRHFSRDFGQYAALPETVARRAALAGTKPQNILVMGDDDFISLGLQILGHQVTVLEIDPILTNLIQRLAKPQYPAIDIRSLDLRSPLDEDLIDKFDLFYTDPLSSEVFLHVALTRGLAALKPSKKGFICVSAAGQTLFQHNLKRLAFKVLGHYTDYNHYYTPSITESAYISDLVTVSPPEDLELIRQLATSPVDTRGIMKEKQFLVTPATHFIAQEIDTQKSHIIHLKTGITLLKNTGILKIAFEKYRHENEYRTYTAITEDEKLIHIRINVAKKTAELFLLPSDAPLEMVIFTTLSGLLKIDRTVYQKHRVRNFNIFEYGI